MSNTRTVTTENSVWFFDFDAMFFHRVPRREDISHPGLRYADVGKPEEFTAVQNIDPYAGMSMFGYDPTQLVVLDKIDGPYRIAVRRPSAPTKLATSGFVEQDTDPTMVIGNIRGEVGGP